MFLLIPLFLFAVDNQKLLECYQIFQQKKAELQAQAEQLLEQQEALEALKNTYMALMKKKEAQLKQKEQELEEKVKQKRESLTKEEAKELLLEKFYELINQQLMKYLNAEKKELIKIFEKLWDKYSISLEQWKKERDEEVQKLNEFLVRLGYYGQK